MSNRGRLIPVCTIVLALVYAGCAQTLNGGSQEPSDVISVPVRITNESPELVHVWFISDSGHKVPIGTVSPYSTAAYSATISRTLSGRLFAHRLSNDAPTPLLGQLEAYALADRIVAIRIGPYAEFDWWQVR